MIDRPRYDQLLVLTNVKQGDNGIGSLYLGTFLDHHSTAATWVITRSFLGSEFLTKLGTPGLLVHMIISRSKIWSSFRFTIYEKFALRIWLRKIVKQIRDSKIEKVVLTTSTPELIMLGARLSEVCPNILILVWDAPEYFVKNLRLPKKLELLTLARFEALWKATSARIVISEPMRAYYKQKFGGDSTVIPFGSTPRRKIQRRSARSIRIAFAGSLYAKSEWNAFVRALELCEWRVDGADVELSFIGRVPLRGVKCPAHIRRIPFCSNEQTLRILDEMDIGYLPYWFDSAHELVARTSFPGKLTSYAAANLAIFHHAPQYSSVYPFLIKYPFGLTCSSLDPNKIADDLRLLVQRMDGKTFREARREAMTTELAKSLMKERFFNCLAKAV